MADAFTGYTEPELPNKRLDAETVTTTAGTVFRQRTQDPEVRDRVGSTADPATANTVIGLLKRLHDAQATGAREATLQALLNAVNAAEATANPDRDATNTHLSGIRTAIDAAETARDADATALQTRANALATEITLAAVLAQLDDATTDTVLSVLKALAGRDFATQATLAGLRTDFAAEDFATQATLAALRTDFNAEDFATEVTLAAVRASLGATADLATADTVIGRLKRLVADLATYEAARDADATTAQARLDLLATEAKLEQVRAAVASAETARDADATSAQTRLDLLATEAKLEQVRAAVASAEAARDADATTAQARLDVLATEATLAAMRASLGENTLTGRLLARRPAVGYRLWLHDRAATNLGTGVILAEAPTGSSTTDPLATVWRGIFIPKDPGQFTERVGFAWVNRLAGWVTE